MEKDKIVELRRAVSHLYQSHNSSKSSNSPLLTSYRRCVSAEQSTRPKSLLSSVQESLTTSMVSADSNYSTIGADLTDSSTNSTPQHDKTLSPESDTSSSSSNSSLIDRMTGNYIHSDREAVPKGLKSRVLYDFIAQGTNELTVHRGEILKTLYHVEQKWIFVVNKSGQFGYIPFLYVTKYDPTCQRRVPSLEKYRQDYLVDEDMESSMTSIPSTCSDNFPISASPTHHNTLKPLTVQTHYFPTVLHRDVDKLCNEEVERNRDSASSDSGNFDGSSNSSSNSVATAASLDSSVCTLPPSCNKPLPLIQNHTIAAQVHREPLPRRPQNLKISQPTPALAQEPNTKKINRVAPVIAIPNKVEQPSPLCTCPHPSYEIWKRRPSFDNAIELQQEIELQCRSNTCRTVSTTRPTNTMTSTFTSHRNAKNPLPICTNQCDQMQKHAGTGKKVTFSKDNEIIGFADNIDRVPYGVTLENEQTKQSAVSKSNLMPGAAENRDTIMFYGDYVPDLSKNQKKSPSTPQEKICNEVPETKTSPKLPLHQAAELYRTMKHNDPDSSIDKYTLV